MSVAQDKSVTDLLSSAVSLATVVLVGLVDNKKDVTKDEVVKYKKGLYKFIMVNAKIDSETDRLSKSVIVVLSSSNLQSRTLVVDGQLSPDDFSDSHDVTGMSRIVIDKSTISAFSELLGRPLVVGSIEVDIFVMEKKTVVVDPSTLIITLDGNKDNIVGVLTAGDMFIVYYKDGTYDKFKVSGNPTPVIEYLNATFNLLQNSTCGRMWGRK